MVPFQDMKGRHVAEREAYLKVIGDVIDSGELAGGRYVEKFERDFATYCGVAHAVGVGSGTEALWLTLLAMGIGPGDEVITVPMSFVATVEAICLTGAKPVFVDIDPHTYTLDPTALHGALTHRAKAIIPVHLFGQPADMAPILEFARQHGLRVIEDAAQAHGAECGGQKVGSIGDAGCFSFYPAKNLGAMGEAGAVVTGDKKLADRIQQLRNHGQSDKNSHALVGWNCRMDGIQGAVLSIKLQRLDHENQMRRCHARMYAEKLSDLSELDLPMEASGRSHVFHIYAIRTPARDRLILNFRANQIEFGVHYPVPIHLQPAFHHLGLRLGDFPISESYANELVSLPMFPEMETEQIDLVVRAICTTFDR
jgi:dTDP-4-amino-4,6-dideoxygalactose transaminase